MPTCFVIQPFDDGRFDKRFNDVYKPALVQAGFEPYRADRDPSVDVPIDSIEEGIRTSTICLADITTDNPNVWYELGYAFAARRSVVMVCADERAGGKFPFDIQHRSVIKYRSESSSDFEELRSKITERAVALRQRAETDKLIENEQVAPQEGLSAIEVQVLALAASRTATLEGSIAEFQLENAAESSGLTGIGLRLALRRLKRRRFVRIFEEMDYEESYSAVALTEQGWSWIDDHESLFVLHKKPSQQADFDDDIPF
jgi:hypothetical protein